MSITNIFIIILAILFCLTFIPLITVVWLAVMIDDFIKWIENKIK